MRPSKRPRREVPWSCPWKVNDVVAYYKQNGDWTLGTVERRRLSNGKTFLIVTLRVAVGSLLNKVDVHIKMVAVADGSMTPCPNEVYKLREIPDDSYLSWRDNLQVNDVVFYHHEKGELKCVVKVVTPDQYIISPVISGVEIALNKKSMMFSPVMETKDGELMLQNSPNHQFFRTRNREWERVDELVGAKVRVRHGDNSLVGFLVDVDYQDSDLNETIYCLLSRPEMEQQTQLRYGDYYSSNNDMEIKWVTKAQIDEVLLVTKTIPVRDPNLSLTTHSDTTITIKFQTSFTQKNKVLSHVKHVMDNGDFTYGFRKLRNCITEDDTEQFKLWRAIVENIECTRGDSDNFSRYHAALDNEQTLKASMLKAKLAFLHSVDHSDPQVAMGYAKVMHATHAEIKAATFLALKERYFRIARHNDIVARQGHFKMRFVGMEVVDNGNRAQYPTYSLTINVRYNGVPTKAIFGREQVYYPLKYLAPIMNQILHNEVQEKISWTAVPNIKFFADVKYHKWKSSKDFSVDIQHKQMETSLIPSLKPYQNWLVQKMMQEEQNPSWLSHFFTMPLQNISYNLISGFSKLEPTKSNGGLLCLGAGLGKTIIAIEIIKRWSVNHPNDTTLIVTPLTLLDQWKSEFAKFAPEIDVKEYYGRKREYGTVTLTTYGKLKSLVPNLLNPVNVSKTFDRVIFDESHKIKNATTLTAKACVKVAAKFRWCLSATPCETLGHLQTQLMMLQIAPMGVRDAAYHIASRPEMYHLLRRVVFGVTRKALKSLNMDPLTTTVTYLPLQLVDNTTESQNVLRILRNIMYDRVINSYSKDAMIRIYLTQLQIATVCPSLLPLSAFSESGSFDVDDIQQITKDAMIAKIQTGNGSSSSSSSSSVSSFQQQVIDGMRDESECSCCICFEPYAKPTILPCLHIFCHGCITKWVQNKSTCPLCKRKTEVSDLKLLVDKADDGKITGEYYEYVDKRGKNRRVLNTTKEMIEKLPVPKKFEHTYKIISSLGDKSLVIFSAHSVVLTRLHAFLKQKGCQVGIITGKTTRKFRERAILGFMERDIKIFLLSTTTAAVGINLQAGSRILFMEPCLNESTKKQAIGRLQRIGQTENITVSTLCARNSYEEKYEYCYDVYKKKIKGLSGKGAKRKELSYRKDMYYDLFHYTPPFMQEVIELV